MSSPTQAVPGREPLDAVLFDLLMAVMDSPEVWAAAAGDRRRGLAWRDGVSARMIASTRYVPYEELVAAAAAGAGLPPSAPGELRGGWAEMLPWPDAAAVERLSLPYGFVTNCSMELAGVAARRSGLAPTFVLAAQEAGWYKPDARIYREACRRLGSDPATTLFVSGSPYDAEGARAAGLRAWLVVRRNDHAAPHPLIRTAHSLDEIVDAIGRDGSAGR